MLRTPSDAIAGLSLAPPQGPGGITDSRPTILWPSAAGARPS